MSEVKPPEHGSMVCTMFGRIAQPYDFLNRFFSMGIDLYWRNCLVKQVLKHLGVTPRCDALILDLATGSGDVAINLKEESLQVVGCDFCFPMLQQALKKRMSDLVTGDALSLPFTDASFHAATIAFGLRNFADRPAAIKEIFRTLKPQGAIHILEFTRPAEWFCGFYFFYLKNIMPRIASVVCRDKAAYLYLAKSVENFPRVEEIAQELSSGGFTAVSWKRLTFGIVALHTGIKN